MTRNELEALRQKFADARKAYFGNQTDGSLDGDIQEKRLQQAFGKAEDEYQFALRQFIESEVA